MKNALMLAVVAAIGLLGFLLYQKNKAPVATAFAPAPVTTASSTTSADPWAQRLLAAGGTLGGVSKLVDSILN
jgi:uncharacterized membrane protein YebE (DUF533 family)